MRTISLNNRFLLALGVLCFFGFPMKGSAEPTCPLYFSKAGLCASVSWTTEPVAEQELAFTLRFWDATSGDSKGPYTDPVNPLFIRLDMPSMGHGGPPVKIAHLKTGEFQISHVYFTMGGKWNLQFQFRLGSGSPVLEEAELPLDVPNSLRSN